jgi:hypothetical protein
MPSKAAVVNKKRTNSNSNKKKSQDVLEEVREQEAEQKRLKEEEQRIAEQKAVLEVAEIKAEEERNSVRREELETLIQCYEESLLIHGRRERKLKEDRSLLIQNRMWNAYMSCNENEWQNMDCQEHFYCLETQLCERILNIKEAVLFGNIICQIIDEIVSQTNNVETKARKDETQASHFVESYLKLAFKTINDALRHLANSYWEYTPSESTADEDVIISEAYERVGAGIWINTKPKGDRSKTISFENMDISLEIPPVLANSMVAIQIISLPVHHMDLPTDCSWDTIGGALRLNLLRLPSTHKQTGNIIVQPIPTSNAPFFTAEGESIRIRIPIPTTVMLRKDTLPLQIGVWDDKEQEWTQNTVANVKIDVQTMSITFDAPSKCGMYSIIQSKDTELKYSHWEIRPSLKFINDRDGTQVCRTVVRYTIRSKNFNLIFLIEEGHCSLLSPVLPQLQNQSSNLLPKELMKALKDSGIILDFRNFPLVPNEKCLRVEERAYSDLSWLSCSFCIRSSKFNPDLDLYKACYLISEEHFLVDDDDVVEEDDNGDELHFYIALTERDSHSLSALSTSDPELKSLPSRCGTVKCSLLEYNQDEMKERASTIEKCILNTNILVAQGSKPGIHLIQCIKPLCSAECLEREMNCSPILADTVKQLLLMTRPLSCC